MTRARWLLLLPFLAPAAAVVCSVAAERGTHEVLAEHTQGRLWPHRGTHRLVLFDVYSPRLWVYDLDGKMIGELGGPGATKEAPLVAGRRVLFVGAQTAVVGRIPLDGGEVRAAEHELPAPVAATYLHAYFPLRVGPSPLALACPKGVTLVRTEAGWARLSPEGARIVRRPGGCRPMRSLGYRPEIPIPDTLSLATSLGPRGGAVLGAPFTPVPYVVGLTPDRRALLRVTPPREEPTLGTALVAGPWVLLVGRRCRMGELRLTLGCLTDPPGVPHRWSSRLLLDSARGCRPDRVPAASICGGQLQLKLPDSTAAWRLEGGARVDPAPARCARMRPLQRGRPAWVSGQELRVGNKTLYRIDRRELSASTGDSIGVNWVVSLPSAGHILGATDRHLLVQLVPDRLLVLDRRDGSEVLASRVAELHDPVERRPSLTQWIGHVGSRAYLLVVRSQRWLQRIRETHLMIYDGERVRVE